MCFFDASVQFLQKNLNPLAVEGEFSHQVPGLQHGNAGNSEETQSIPRDCALKTKSSSGKMIRLCIYIYIYVIYICMLYIYVCYIYVYYIYMLYIYVCYKYKPT